MPQPTPGASPPAHLTWSQQGQSCAAPWHSMSGLAAPRRITAVDDTTSADAAIHLASEGTAMLWHGDFVNARHLMDAMERRIAARAQRQGTPSAELPLAFHQQRQSQAHRARILGQLLLHFQADHSLALRRAPDTRLAVFEARGASAGPYVASLRELLGMISAHEWRKRGVPVAALEGAAIHPHYGVFAPVRSEYLDLVAQAPLPVPLPPLAFDIGTGTGVIAAILARRGVGHVVATDLSPGALHCAADNLQRLGLSDRVTVQGADLFPDGLAPLIVCNPPWLPGKPASWLDHAVYDERSQMLRGFLAGLPAHLTPGGQGWLVISDLAERLRLRAPGELQGLFDAAGLRVIERHDTRPRHARSQDRADPLHAARSGEITSLWRLAAA